jgi:hypothetical protein
VYFFVLRFTALADAMNADNYIGTDGGRALAKALETNRTLTVLDLQCTWCVCAKNNTVTDSKRRG